MNKLRSQRKGFTLIEMLVVIAIIALLASILVPAVTGALAKGDRTKYTSYARGLYLTVFGTITDSGMTRSGGNFFPSNTPPTTPDTYTAGNSSSYFEWLMTIGKLEEDFEVFGSLPGMTYATAPDELDSSTNPWCVVENTRITSPPSMPFIFTANVDEAALTDGVATPNTALTIDDSDVQLEDVIILCNMGGGAGALVGEEALIWGNLNPTDETNNILTP